MPNKKHPCSKHGLFYPDNQNSSKITRWYSNYFCPFIGFATRLITDEIGKDNIDGILLCGSFATGEGSVVIKNSRTIFLSDVDILVGVNSLSVHQAILSAKRELGNKCEELWDKAEFRGRVNIGIYHSKQLSSLPPSPGVYDMKERGVVLSENKEFKERFPSYRNSDITRREALKLIENRIAAHIGAHRLTGKKDEDYKYELIYSVSRVYTDILISCLIFAGEYQSGYLNRLKHLREKRENPLLKKLIPKKMFEKIERWTGFKLKQSNLAMNVSPKDMWEESASDLFRYWELLQSERFNDKRSGDVITFLKSRKSNYSFLMRLRLWRGYFKRFYPYSAFTGFLKIGANIYRYSPDELILKYGIILLKVRLEKGERVYVDRPPGSFPYGRSLWSKAAEKLYSAWVELVSG
ncbi:MAG TPA: hypothetical protein VKO43_06550 [Candidatus Krumholzibacteriaceae bacterium]|nr:hypothetical protein [Candidatus Krumholzibacteriaceae bacterium]